MYTLLYGSLFGLKSIRLTRSCQSIHYVYVAICILMLHCGTTVALTDTDETQSIDHVSRQLLKDHVDASGLERRNSRMSSGWTSKEGKPFENKTV